MLPSFSQAADLMDKEALEERDRLSESLMRVRFAAFEKRRMELIHMVVKQRVCASLPSVICTPHTRAKKITCARTQAAQTRLAPNSGP